MKGEAPAVPMSSPPVWKVRNVVRSWDMTIKIGTLGVFFGVLPFELATYVLNLANGADCPELAAYS